VYSLFEFIEFIVAIKIVAQTYKKIYWASLGCIYFIKRVFL